MMEEADCSMYRKIMRKATLVAILAGLGAAFPTSAWANEVLTSPLEFNNWTVSGSLTDKKANQTITLPGGSTFNGGGEIVLEVSEEGTLANISGTLTGKLFVPEFSQQLTLAGYSTPITTELSFNEVGTSQGTISKDPTSAEPAAVIVNVASRANMGLTEVGLLGIQAPVHCITSEPVQFNLLEHTTFDELVNAGPRFAGTVTLPSFTCEGLQGAVVSPVVSTLLSGPENPYTIAISPPA
jgi:hypothetical protein